MKRPWLWLPALVLAALATGIGAAAMAQSHPPTRTHAFRPGLIHRLGPAWKIPSHGGAMATVAGSAVPLCRAGALTASFWTSTPSMMGDISGFNVTNKSTASCRLASYPAYIAAASPAGTPIRHFPLLNMKGNWSRADFSDAGLSVVPSFGASQVRASSRGLTLRPGGTAVVLLSTFNKVAEGQRNPRCLTLQRGGSLKAGLGRPGTVTVTMPAGSWGGAASPLDPAGSAFYTCSTVKVSPFITWAQAKKIVGIPVPEAPGLGALPVAHRSMYAAAP